MRPLLAASLMALAASACQSSGVPEGPGPISPKAAAAGATQTDRFEPAKGVSCSRSAQVCKWRGGPTLGLTRLFFGNAAAEALVPSLAPAHYPNDPIFKPNPDASCDTLVTTCYDRGGASDALTDKYFGSEAARLLKERRRQIERYGEHVTCDQASKICYDRFGAGVGITQLYLGDPESKALLARLRAH